MASELELAWGPALRSGLELALVLGLAMASELVSEWAWGPALRSGLELAFLVRLGRGSVVRVERAQSRRYCFAY
jgi:hypothetical protein